MIVHFVYFFHKYSLVRDTLTIVQIRFTIQSIQNIPWNEKARLYHIKKESRRTLI